MKKIPTLFERDWAGDKSRVVDKVHPGCEWVTLGEGIATRKLDGTSCLIRHGHLYKRRELSAGDFQPIGFELSDSDPETGKTIGWLPVRHAPEDQWHKEALLNDALLPDGTYELVGPKIQGNKERFAIHSLVSHEKTGNLPDAPRTFAKLKAYLTGRDIEGIVWHHPDGRMAKIKARDFGIKR